MILTIRALPQHYSGLMDNFGISSTVFQYSLIARIVRVGKRKASFHNKWGYDEFSDLVFILQAGIGKFFVALLTEGRQPAPDGLARMKIPM